MNTMPSPLTDLPREHSNVLRRLELLEADPILRGPLDVIEAREEHARRLIKLVDAVAAFLAPEQG